MKITVLNGSPKGDQSVTMQYIHFIQKKFPQHQLDIINISQKIRKIEKNADTRQEIIQQIRSADAIIWAFPLYFCLVHGNYLRFIELIYEMDFQDAFKNKYAAALSTSIHFYDHTAHNYIHAICDDLDMKYVDFHSAEMRDLFEKEGQERLILFAENFLNAIETKQPTLKRYYPVNQSSFEYRPGNEIRSVDTEGKKVVIVTDNSDENTNTGKMIARFRRSFSTDVDLVVLDSSMLKGGCTGCLQCSYDNTCIWEGKDGYIDMYKNVLIPADIIIFSGTIKARFLSSTWKTFLDRSFFNNHRPSLMNKQFGFIFSGPLSQNENLMEILNAYVEFQNSNVAGIVTDECGDSQSIDRLLQNLAENIIHHSKNNYRKPGTFRGVAGAKLFRDEIYGNLRFVFQADHRYYKKHRLYNFPQKDYKTRLLNALGWLVMKIPPFRKRFYSKELKSGMIRNHQRLIEKMPIE